MSETAEVVVGYDGTAQSEPALRLAVSEAARTRRTLRVLRVWRTVPYVGAVPGYGFQPLAQYDDTGRQLAELTDEAVAKVTADNGHEDLHVVVDVRPGDAATHLAEASRTAAVVVIGTRHHGALVSALVGSATNYLLHHAACPVLVVAPEAPGSWGQVVVGVDGSDSSLAALRWAAEQAAGASCPLVVVHAWEIMSSPDWVMVPLPEPPLYDAQVRDWLEDLVQQTPGTSDLAVECRSVHGRTPPALLDAVSAQDLLVVGARGRGRFDDLLLGSVSQSCVHHARGSVAVVHDRKART